MRKMPPVQLPVAQERAYLEFVLANVLRPIRDAVDAEVVPNLVFWTTEARLDAWHDSLTDAIKGIGAKVASLFEPLIPGFLNRTGTSVAEHARRQTARQVSGRLGIDVLVHAPPGVAAQVRTWTTTNTRLIKSIETQYLGRVEALLLREIQKGTRPDAIAKMLVSEYNISVNRAALIAQDQTTKFFGATTRAQHEDLGITSYFWRTIGDLRVRVLHALRNGRLFRYADAPSDGHPGFPIRCRCHADPNVDAVLDA